MIGSELAVHETTMSNFAIDSGSLGEPHRVPVQLRRQRLRALDRAVGHDDRLRVARGEVRCGEFDHLAGADEQDLAVRKRAEDALGGAHRCRGHRHRLRADVGRRAHFLRDGEGALEQVVQQQPHAAGFAREPLGLLHLAEDLRLAEHHRIQTAGHAERVAHGIGLRQNVRRALQFLRFEALFGGDEVGERMAGGDGFFDRAVQFGPVAGGHDRGFGEPAGVASGEPVAQPRNGVADLFGHECDPLAQRERRGLVIHAESQQLHGRSKPLIRVRL